MMPTRRCRGWDKTIFLHSSYGEVYTYNVICLKNLTYCFYRYYQLSENGIIWLDKKVFKGPINNFPARIRKYLKPLQQKINEYYNPPYKCEDCIFHNTLILTNNCPQEYETKNNIKL